MGNQQSSSKNKEGKTKLDEDPETKDMKIENVIDHIASKFITQASFQELQNLHKQEYCNKLVVLTSKIIKHHLNDMEIDYMAQRTEKGVEINKTDKASVLYLAKDDLDRLDVSNPTKKQRMCIGIAKFYIKIAHLFAAIAMTINPQYTYTDSNGEEKTISIHERNKMPPGTNYKYTRKNLCSRRIQALKPTQNTENGIRIKGKNCKMNLKIQKEMDGINLPIENLQNMMFIDEPGIPQLELLYYDDYNLNTGKYVGMTEKYTAKYKEDLETFYTTFTGDKSLPNDFSVRLTNLPIDITDDILRKIFKSDGTIEFIDIKSNGSAIIRFAKTSGQTAALKRNETDNGGFTIYVEKYEIKKFSDIPLKDFHNQQLCKDTTSPWHRSYLGKPSSKLFKDYADHYKKMISESQQLEKKLLTVVKEVFSYWVDPQKREKQLTINPELNMSRLQELIDESRENIIQLYINCERDFQKGLEIFESIVRSKMVETSQQRIQNFDKKAEQLKESKTDHIPDTDVVAPMTSADKEIVVETESEITDTSIGNPENMPATQINSNVNINIEERERPDAPRQPPTSDPIEQANQQPVSEPPAVVGGARRRRRKTRKRRFYKNKSRKRRK